MYQSATGSGLPLNSRYKQEPKGLPASAFGSVKTPAVLVVTKNPSYVLINQTGSYAFLYTTTASRGTTYGIPEDYTQGIVIEGSGQGPIKLDISPVAWSGSFTSVGSADGGTVQTGDVTFVYRGGL